MIVRWGIGELPGLAGERPFVVASPRWHDVLEAPDRWDEVPSHRIEVPDGVDTIVAIGGGSAIDTGKAASAASGLPLVSVPTTYSGAEWTSSTASATLTAACAAAAPARTCTRSSTSRS